MKPNSLYTLFLLLLLGCAQRPDAAPLNHDAPADPVVYDSEWNDRNGDIYRFLLAELDEPAADQICFVTITPMAEWGETGNWTPVPADQLKSTPRGAQYRPANEAYLKDGRVLEKGTNAEARMHWISVKRWINNNEVEVESGDWCCPLGGGGLTTIYEKVDGQWRVKEHGGVWVS